MSAVHPFRPPRRTCRPLLAVGLPALALLAACSHRDLYETVRQNHLQRCEQIPIAQQAACKAQYRTTYDEYRRALERTRTVGAP